MSNKNGYFSFFKNEFNNAKMQQLGASVQYSNENGSEIKIGFQYNILGRVSKEKLLEMVQQSNPTLYIHYDKRTLGDNSQTKETDKPIWDFEVSEDGKTVILKRT